MGNVKENKDKIIDVDFGTIARTKIRVNGDNTKVIELNLSDMGIIARLNDAYPKLDELSAEVKELASAEIPEDDDASALSTMAEQFKLVNSKMCDLVDMIFDFPVCAVLCDGGSMYDIVGGMYRFEYIIDKLSKLYENNMNEEYKRMQSRVAMHTTKYTRKKK